MPANNIIYHYTTFDSLKKILRLKSLRLNRLDKVNDPAEENRITSFWKNRIFVSCFTHRLDNADYFWKNYGAIRLSFYRDDLNLSVYFDPACTMQLRDYKKNFTELSQAIHPGCTTEDWCTYELSVEDITYVEDLDKYVDTVGCELNAGLIKLKGWEIEAETRIRVLVHPVGLGFHYQEEENQFQYYSPDFGSLYVPLPYETANIEISPYCSAEYKEEIAAYLAGLPGRMPSPSKLGTKLSSTVPPY